MKNNSVSTSIWLVQKLICVIFWTVVFVFFLTLVFAMISIVVFPQMGDFFYKLSHLFLWGLFVSWEISCILVFLEFLPGSEQHQQCPFCAEKIKIKAVVCRHCNKELEIEIAKEVVGSTKVFFVTTTVVALFLLAMALMYPEFVKSRVFFGNDEEIIYYPPVTKKKAIVIGKALQKQRFFNAKGAKTVLVSKNKKGFFLSFVLQDGVWNEPQAIEYFHNLGKILSKNFLNYQLFQIHLCDSSLKIRKKIDIKIDNIHRKQIVVEKKQENTNQENFKDPLDLIDKTSKNFLLEDTTKPNKRKKVDKKTIAKTPANLSISQKDLKQLAKKFNTESLQAALYINIALKNQDPKEALKMYNKALQLDPNNAIALFNKGVLLKDTDSEKAISIYQKIVNSAFESNNATIGAFIKLSELYGLKHQYSFSNFWLSQVFIEDPDNAQKEYAKAYHNMSVNLYRKQKYFSAAIAGMQSLRYNPQATNIQNIYHFLKQSKAPRSAKILWLKDKNYFSKPKNIHTKLSFVSQIKIKEAISFLTDFKSKFIIALSQEKNYYYLIKNKTNVKKIALQKNIVCANISENHLYFISLSPAQLHKVNVYTGALIKSYDLGNAKPKSLVVYAKQNNAYFTVNERVYLLRLASGKILATHIPGDYLFVQPNQKYVYSYVVGRNAVALTHLIKRPLLSTKQRQFCIFKSRVHGRRLILAGVYEHYGLLKTPIKNNFARHFIVPTKEEQKYNLTFLNNHNVLLQQRVTVEGPIDSYSINPVTGQIAIATMGKLKLYNPDAKKYTTVELKKGQTIYTMVWSSNGKYLILSDKKSILIYQNKFSLREIRVRAKIVYHMYMIL